MKRPAGLYSGADVSCSETFGCLSSGISTGIQWMGSCLTALPSFVQDEKRELRCQIRGTRAVMRQNDSMPPLGTAVILLHLREDLVHGQGMHMRRAVLLLIILIVNIFHVFHLGLLELPVPQMLRQR